MKKTTSLALGTFAVAMMSGAALAQDLENTTRMDGFRRVM